MLRLITGEMVDWAKTEEYFKTSYVTVNLFVEANKIFVERYFKTSYVTVNHLQFCDTIIYYNKFQNILCYG